MSRLRRVLPVPPVGRPAGCLLRADPALTDAHRFARLGAEGRRAFVAGDPGQAAGLQREALVLSLAEAGIRRDARDGCASFT